MTQTLYRKYRPKQFDEIVGQGHITKTLLHELATKRLAHAYLFTGPRGVGKTTIARLMAKAVNCLHPKKDGSPDNACEACADIQSGRCLDLIEIDAASNTGVDHVREQIIENARFTPSRWKYKVFIIDEVHMLSLSAFNALLKTLEEPPEHVLFILATTEIHKVPETIISRCQRFDFRALPYDDIVGRLEELAKQEKVKIDRDVLQAIAVRARGSARDAESMLGQIISLGEKHITQTEAELVLPRSDNALILKLFAALVRSDAKEGITLVNGLVSEGVNLSRFTEHCIEALRKLMLCKVDGQLSKFSAMEFSNEDEAAVKDLLSQTSVEAIQGMLEAFIAADAAVRTSQIPHLPLELAVVSLTVAPVEPSSVPADRRVLQPALGVAPVAKPQVTPAKEQPPKLPEKPSSGQSASAPVVVKKNMNAGAISIDAVKNVWPDVLQKLQQINQSLRLTFHMAEVQRVAEQTVHLGVGYDFHRERIESPKNKVIVQDVLSQVLGQPVLISVEVVPDMQKQVDSFEQEANIEPVAQIVAGPAPQASAPKPVAGLPEGEAWNALVEMFGSKPA